MENRIIFGLLKLNRRLFGKQYIPVMKEPNKILNLYKTIPLSQAMSYNEWHENNNNIKRLDKDERFYKQITADLFSSNHEFYKYYLTIRYKVWKLK